MPALAELARIDPRGPLADEDLARDAAKLTRPGQDYPKACYLIWRTLREQATRTGEKAPHPENPDRPGWIVTGMGPVQAIGLLWPQWAQHTNSQKIIRVHLRDFEDLYCIRPNRGRNSSVQAEWWVADEFNPIVLGTPGRPGSRVTPRKDRANTVRPSVRDDYLAQLDHLIADVSNVVERQALIGARDTILAYRKQQSAHASQMSNLKEALDMASEFLR